MIDSVILAVLEKLMKKMFLLCCLIILSGCSYSSLDRLKKQKALLQSQNQEYINLETSLEVKCKKAIIAFSKANSSNIDELKVQKENICGELAEVVENVLENNQKLVDIEINIQEYEGIQE